MNRIPRRIFTAEFKVEVRYAMIDRLRNNHPVSKLCDLLNVDKSGYQVWSAGRVIPPANSKTCACWWRLKPRI